jgi:nicotinamide-nucleotide amidase
MHIEILTIGDELLDGLTVDGNAARLGRMLDPVGLRLARRMSVRDRIPDIVAAMNEIAARAEVCIVSGGLGPTSDDLTVDALAVAADVPLFEDPEVWARIVARFDGRAPTANNRRQARVPEGGRALQSEIGTAPGIELALGGCTFFLLPGVPREFQWHLEAHVLPLLRERIGERLPPRSRILRFVGIGESAIGARIERLGLSSELAVAYRVRDLDIEVRVRGADPEAVSDAAARIAAAGEETFVGEGDVSLVELVLDACRRHGLTLATAESCTGGLVSSLLTAVPGASDVFRGGVVAYANSVKTQVLGVPPPRPRKATVPSVRRVPLPWPPARAAFSGRTSRSPSRASPARRAARPRSPSVPSAWPGPVAALDRVTTVLLRGDRDRIRLLSASRALDGIRRGLGRSGAGA